MMKLDRAFILALLPVALSAQAPRDVAPLKAWPAPLYWHPAPAEIRSASPQAEQLGPSSLQTQTLATSLLFVAMTPCRVVDTRTGSGFTGAFGAPGLVTGIRTFPIQSSTNCSIPSAALAYSFNVTAIPPASLAYITVYPAGQPQPLASTLNDFQGTVVANAAIVPAGTGGSVNVYANNPTDLVIDINGYYALPSDASGNTAIGSMVLHSDTTGINNTGLGANALNGNTSGNSNTAAGVFALGSNTAGSQNTASGNLALSSNTVGNQNTATGERALLNNISGSQNTATGASALLSNTSGSALTATGYGALGNNTTGTNNTASGSLALADNISGSQNTATGAGGLQFNTLGDNNTANGYLSLGSNTTGGNNTATGYRALGANISGVASTATGSGALQLNTTGQENTADGFNALQANTMGAFNTATGALALSSNTVGAFNTGCGFGTLQNTTTGNQNTAGGYNALINNVTGSGNIAIGYLAAQNVTGSNSNNIHIGNQGTSGDNGVIRIGDAAAQTSFFVAPVRGVTTALANAVPVVIDSNGQLGTVSSSRRFKEDIQNMGDASDALLRLRPVTFRYKQPYADGSKPLDYGLIAEEVAEVYPDLAVRGADGQIETVQYQKLSVLLLNEVQKLSRRIEDLEKALASTQR